MAQSMPDRNLYDLPWTIDSYRGMPYRSLGSTGLRVSNVGLGTWKFGYPETGDEARVGEKAAFEILDRAADLGVTFWDTANRYNNASGNSERILGAWFKSNPRERRNIILATKIFGSMDGRTPNHCRLSRTSVLDGTYASLERLQVDCLDILYFHDFDPTTPADESLLAVEDLISRDLVRYFAVSNFTKDQLSLYRATQQMLTPRCRIVAVQNQFDILNGENPSYEGALDYATRMGIAFIAWSPLAGGLISDRYLDLAQVGAGDRLYDEGILESVAGGEQMVRLRDIAALAQEWNMKPSQLAMAYMLTLPGMGPLIPSVSNLEQLESNAEAGKVELSEEQIARFNSLLAQW